MQGQNNNQENTEAAKSKLSFFARITREKIFFLVVIFATAIFLTRQIRNDEPYPTGDGLEYLFMSEAFYNHMSPDIRLRDVNKFIYEYSQYKPLTTLVKQDAITQLALNLKIEKNPGYNEQTHLWTSKNNKVYFQHFWLYSFTNLPMRFIVDVLNLNPVRSFQFTNLAMILVVMTIIFFFTRLSTLMKTASALLFLYSSTFWYITWLHTECFTACLVFLSVILYFDKKIYLPILLASLASTQNPPLFLLTGIFIANALITNKFTIRNFIFIAINSCWTVLPLVFNYYNFGKLNLIVGNYLDSSHITFQRFWGFFFDLNQGMIIGMPFILPIAIALFAYEVTRIKKHFSLSVFFIPIVAAMTFFVMPMINWNEGQAVIKRYAVWASMIILAYFIYKIEKLKILPALIIFSIVFLSQVIVVHASGGTGIKDWECYKHKSIAKWVLNNYPALYNPDPQIFAIRTAENVIYDTKFLSKYQDSSGAVCKILVHQQRLAELTKFKISPSKIEKIRNDFAPGEDEHIYINKGYIEENSLISENWGNILCDAETLTSTGNYYLLKSEPIDSAKYGKLNQTSDFAFSGKYSDKLSKDNIYGMTIYLRGVVAGDTYTASVWQMGERNTATLIVSSVNSSKFYKNTETIAKKEKGWQQISITFTVPNECNNDTLLIYPMNKGKDFEYFDDLNIKKH